MLYIHICEVKIQTHLLKKYSNNFTDEEHYQHIALGNCDKQKENTLMSINFNSS